MGYERDYEYGPVPTEPNGELPATAAPSRCRSRHSIFGRLVLIAVAAYAATWAARQYTLQKERWAQEWEVMPLQGAHPPCGGMRPPQLLEPSPAEAKISEIETDFNTGTVLKCFHPGDDNDVTGPVHLPLPRITLDSDNVYFFDLPKNSKPRDDERPHKRPRWNTAGTFTLDVSDKVDKVTVDASIGITDTLFARICTFEREDGAKGVGVVVPDEDPAEDRLNYVKFAVKVPKKAEFKGFETALWNWTHSVADIGGSVLFKSLSFTAVNGGIDVKSISAHVANATTINGNITGTYAAQDAFKLVTVNGVIGVDIDFKSTSAETSAILELHTINGAILADVSLGTTDDFAGAFKVSGTTANAPVSINITAAPINSILNVTASTISAPANLSLPATFEGTFDARTFGPTQQASIHTRQDVKDPEGRGRKRTVSSHTVTVPFGNGIAGEVFWGDEVPEKAGHAKVSTLFAPASVLF